MRRLALFFKCMKLVFLRLSHLEWRLDFLYQTNFSHYINVSLNLDIHKAARPDGVPALGLKFVSSYLVPRLAKMIVKKLVFCT